MSAHTLATNLLRISVVAIVAVTLFATVLVVYARSQHLLILSVQTGSMKPAIRPGDAVLVRQRSVQLSQLKVGDIISYRSLQNQNAVITHRLVAIDRQHNMLTTKGDGLPEPDPQFSADNLVGVAQQTVPFAGYVLNFLRKPIGLVAAVYIPAVMLQSGEIRRLLRFYSRQRYVLYYH